MTTHVMIDCVFLSTHFSIYLYILSIIFLLLGGLVSRYGRQVVGDFSFGLSDSFFLTFFTMLLFHSLSFCGYLQSLLHYIFILLSYVLSWVTAPFSPCVSLLRCLHDYPQVYPLLPRHHPRLHHHYIVFLSSIKHYYYYLLLVVLRVDHL